MEMSQGNISARVKQLMEEKGMNEADAVEQAAREEGSGVLLKMITILLQIQNQGVLGILLKSGLVN